MTVTVPVQVSSELVMTAMALVLVSLEPATTVTARALVLVSANLKSVPMLTIT